MAGRWQARSNSTEIEVGSVFRLIDGFSASAPPEAMLARSPFDLVTADGKAHRGIVAAIYPGHLVIHLDTLNVYLHAAPAGSGAPGPDVGDGRTSDWTVERVEASFHGQADPAGEGASEAIPQGEDFERNFAEGQLPGMPVSHDPLRELGPTPGLVERRSID